MSKKIPKASKIPSNDNKIVPPSINTKNKKISFSFESLERTEYFNLDGTCINWSSELFEMLKEVSTREKSELLSGKIKSYRIHDHRNATPPSKLPDGVSLNDFYQIRISKSKGAIHGVFYENIFYIVWLDPLHNMYPNDHYGGLRKIKPPSTCCRDREDSVKLLSAENEKLKAEKKELEELLE